LITGSNEVTDPFEHVISGLAALAKKISTGAIDSEPRYREPGPDSGSQVAFYGGSFTALPVEHQNMLLEAAQPFLRLDSNNSIRISTRPDCIDETTLDRLKSFGVATIEIGAQSMCDDVLRLSRRGHTAGDVKRSSKMIKDEGFSLVLQMMTGLPGDTAKKSIYTAERFIDIGPDSVRIYPTVVVKGTKLHEMWQNGEYREHTVEEAVVLCARIYGLFASAGIPVIRIGLNPGEALDSGGVAAGAYHPAFGELVYSKIYYDKAASLLGGAAQGCSITIIVAKGQASAMAGNRRANTLALKKEFGIRSVKIVETDITPGEIKISITQ